MRNYIKTVKDMEEYYYGRALEFQKADNPILSTTTGVYNPIFGAKVWSQLNQEQNVFALLPKAVWDKSGWRVITGRAAASGGGVAENATLPDTIKPTFLEVSTKPKIIAHTFNASEMETFLGAKDDGLGDVMKVLREEMAKHHAEMINKMLLADVNTTITNDIESIDRVVSSSTEETNCLTAGDADIYGIDRSAVTWADAYVDENADVDRTFTIDLLDTALTNVRKNGGIPKVIITGYDTLERIHQALQAQQRFLDSRTIVPTYNGVRGVEGVEAGFTVASYQGIPIIPSKDVLQDTISRIYILDTDYLFFKVALPTMYFESGMSKKDPFGINYLGDEGLYRTMGELICTRFNVHGKIRDMK